MLLSPDLLVKGILSPCLLNDLQKRGFCDKRSCQVNSWNHKQWRYGWCIDWTIGCGMCCGLVFRTEQIFVWPTGEIQVSAKVKKYEWLKAFLFIGIFWFSIWRRVAVLGNVSFRKSTWFPKSQHALFCWFCLYTSIWKTNKFLIVWLVIQPGLGI